MKSALPAVLAATFTLTACTGGVDNSTASGAATGGVVGAIAATALGADTHELILGTAVGAMIGAAAVSQGGQNTAQQGTARCVYSDGRGGTYEATC